MARFGTWKPLAGNWASQPKMAPDIISLHTMVMSLDACDAMWRRTGYTGSHSHFGVGHDGTVFQWQDTAYRAAANYNGNHHIISVETADRGTGFPDWNINDGSAVPAWRPEQIEALAQLVATMCKAHDIPCVLIPDAKPGRRGIGFHRQGVPGYMVAGAEQWSSSRGKVCPGDRRISQIPQVLTRARQILAGAPQPTILEEDMPLNGNDANTIWRSPLLENQGVPILHLINIENQVTALVASLSALTKAVQSGGGTLTPDQAVAAGQAGAQAALRELGQELAS